MAVSLSTAVVASDDIAFREIEQEGVLLNLETGTYFGLNQVGTRAWTLLLEGKSVGEVHAQLSQEYEVAPDVLERDLIGWVGALVEKGLVREK